MPLPLELLAPAGSVDVFQTAVEYGADAIYIGAPAANARALARHFTLEEIAAMNDFAHQRRVKLYVAMNSLVREEELPAVVQLLSVLAGIGVDGLIVQDLGVYRLVRHYFPELRLHASTLMGAHNSLNVRQFAEMGFSRVVLARELDLDEIRAAAAGSPVEIEVFVHGAMCFAYSGLCLFSSFLGGKSGLRGRCVQPCRRKYTWQGPGAKGGGYLFSMNDLEGIDLLEQLRQAGVRSLKIEGRMRSRQYVGAVVRAYRMVLDHPGDPAAKQEADRLLALAMGRKTTTGYFLPPADEALITPQYSGNIGLFIGKLGKCREGRAEMKLREALAIGDRIRVHNEKSGERDSVTVKELWSAGRSVDSAMAGETVGLAVPATAQVNDPVYKVDSSDSRQEAAKGKAIQPQHFSKRIVKERQRERIRSITAAVTSLGRAGGAGRGLSVGPAAGGSQGSVSRQDGRRRPEAKATGLPLPWWLRVDDLAILRQLPRENPPARIVVLLTKETFRQYKRGSVAGEQRRGLIWALPPVIVEGDLDFYRPTVAGLVRQGFQDWQLSHIGQLQVLREAMTSCLAPPDSPSSERRGRDGAKKHGERPRRLKVTLCGHYSLNVMNSQALKALAEAGIPSAQLTIEADRALVANIGQRKSGPLGLTVYGFPLLFTARPAPSFFSYGQKFVSPKGEGFVLQRGFDQTLAVPVQPFSLLDRVEELKAAGIDYLVIDLTANLLKRGELVLLWRRLQGGHKAERLSSFNYGGTLQ